MPLYEFHCPACPERFTARRPVDDRDLPVPCPCGAAAFRRFDPRAVLLNVTIDPKVTRHRDLHGFESTPEHSAEYNFRQQDEKNVQRFHAHFESRKPAKTVKERLLERWPDTDLSQPLTKQDVQEVSTLLAAGPPGATHAR